MKNNLDFPKQLVLGGRARRLVLFFPAPVRPLVTGEKAESRESRGRRISKRINKNLASAMFCAACRALPKSERTTWRRLGSCDDHFPPLSPSGPLSSLIEEVRALLSCEVPSCESDA